MSFRSFMNDGIIHIISALLLPNDVFTYISIAVVKRNNKMKYKENHTVRTIPTSIRILIETEVQWISLTQRELI